MNPRWKIIDRKIYIPPVGSIFYRLSNPKHNWQTAYHGTTTQAAVKILKEGFKIQKSSYDKYRCFCKSKQKGFYFGLDPKTSLFFAQKYKYKVKVLT